jgi:hypothetical protein
MEIILLCEILIKEQRVEFGMISSIPGIKYIHNCMTVMQG